MELKMMDTSTDLGDEHSDRSGSLSMTASRYLSRGSV